MGENFVGSDMERIDATSKPSVTGRHYIAIVSSGHISSKYRTYSEAIDWLEKQLKGNTKLSEGYVYVATHQTFRGEPQTKPLSYVNFSEGGEVQSMADLKVKEFNEQNPASRPFFRDDDY